MESYFLNAGLSWTMSKVLPYFIMILVGIVLWIIAKKLLKSLNKFLRWALLLVIFLMPFGIYFSISPIYEGDFSNNAIEVMRSDANAELTGKKLVVITIPGCPFCLQAIDQLLVMKKRVPNIEIEYIVCSSDSTTVDWYKENAGDDITVRLAVNSEEMAKIAQHAFPTFVLVDNNHPIKTWSNDSFGVFARDEIELEFN
jgi:thioredoxin-related protein